VDSFRKKELPKAIAADIFKRLKLSEGTSFFTFVISGRDKVKCG
jgi:hypothetical protein